jgi:hypothetical protein
MEGDPVECFMAATAPSKYGVLNPLFLWSCWVGVLVVGRFRVVCVEKANANDD